MEITGVRDVAKYSLRGYFVDEPCPRLGLGLLRAVNDPRRGRGTAWARLCNEVVVVTAMTKAHCQGHIGAVEGCVQREARHNTRHASILCSSMSPGGGWRDWGLHRHKETRRCQSRREAGGPRRQDSLA